MTQTPDPPHETGVPAQQREGPELTRLSVNVTQSTLNALREYSITHGVTVTESVRRLVAYGNVIYQANRAGKNILFESDGQVERVLIID